MVAKTTAESVQILLTNASPVCVALHYTACIDGVEILDNNMTTEFVAARIACQEKFLAKAKMSVKSISIMQN